MSNHEEKALDRALSSGQPGEGDVAALTEIGERIRNAYLTITPNHRAQRAMFVTAVAAQRRSAGWMRALAPVTVTALLLIGVMFLGRTALPGQAFYPVREVLRTVGLAPVSSEEINTLFEQADSMLDEAESASMTDPGRGERLAFQATRIIGMAEGAIDELEVDEQARFTDELGDLLTRAKAILAADVPSEEEVDDGDKAFVRDDDDDGDDSGENADDETDGDNSGNGEDPTEDRDTAGVTNRDERDDDNDGGDDDGGNSGPGGGDEDDTANDTDNNDDEGDTDGDNSGPGDGDFDDNDLDQPDGFDDPDDMEEDEP